MARRSEAAFLLGTLTISIVLFSLLPPQGAFSGALTRLGILFGVAALFGEAHRMLEEAPLNRLCARAARADGLDTAYDDAGAASADDGSGRLRIRGGAGRAPQ